MNDEQATSEWSFGESVYDPLQDAITSTEVACRTAEGETLVALQEHLARLLELQYARLTGVDE